jgi:hypothetical protein
MNVRSAVAAHRRKPHELARTDVTVCRKCRLRSPEKPQVHNPSEVTLYYFQASKKLIWCDFPFRLLRNKWGIEEKRWAKAGLHRIHEKVLSCDMPDCRAYLKKVAGVLLRYQLSHHARWPPPRRRIV